MKSINTSFTNLVRRDLARERKFVKCYIMPLPRLSYIYLHIYFKKINLRVAGYFLQVAAIKD